MEFLLSLLVYAIVLVVVYWLGTVLINALVPEPAKGTALKIWLVLIVLAVLFGLIGYLPFHGPIFWPRRP